MKSKLSPKFWCALTVFSLIGQIAWVVENMYLNVFIYKLFAASADQIALMVSCSAVAATVTTIIMGAVSDKVGKRKLFMVGGYLSSMAVFGAYIKGRMPVENVGLFQGPRILCQVLIPGVVGPFIGARVLSGQEYMTGSDGTQSFIPNENIFLAALIVIIVLIPFVVKLSDRRTKK